MAKKKKKPPKKKKKGGMTKKEYEHFMAAYNAQRTCNIGWRPGHPEK